MVWIKANQDEVVWRVIRAGGVLSTGRDFGGGVLMSETFGEPLAGNDLWGETIHAVGLNIFYSGIKYTEREWGLYAAPYSISISISSTLAFR